VINRGSPVMCRANGRPGRSRDDVQGPQQCPPAAQAPTSLPYAPPQPCDVCLRAAAASGVDPPRNRPVPHSRVGPPMERAGHGPPTQFPPGQRRGMASTKEGLGEERLKEGSWAALRATTDGPADEPTTCPGSRAERSPDRVAASRGHRPHARRLRIVSREPGSQRLRRSPPTAALPRSPVTTGRPPVPRVLHRRPLGAAS
jgi:hypothetical protein